MEQNGGLRDLTNLTQTILGRAVPLQQSNTPSKAIDEASLIKTCGLGEASSID